VREAAIVALCTLLDANANINKVRRDSDLDQLSAAAMPCVVVTDNGNEVIERKTSGYADVYVTLDLLMVVAKGKNQSTALNTIDTAVKTVIAANPTLSGTVAHATILPQVDGDSAGSDDMAKRMRQVRLFYEATEASGL